LKALVELMVLDEVENHLEAAAVAAGSVVGIHPVAVDTVAVVVQLAAVVPTEAQLVERSHLVVAVLVV
jgi:polysaccharide deacetylase 2 family uncharacterized protein YibQ